MTDKTQDFAAHDFFRSDKFVNDPYAYFDYLRAQSPVLREPHQGVFMVTGYDEALEVYNAPDRFSSCMSTTGPFAGNPIPLAGHEHEDISELIEQTGQPSSTTTMRLVRLRLSSTVSLSSGRSVRRSITSALIPCPISSCAASSATPTPIE